MNRRPFCRVRLVAIALLVVIGSASVASACPSCQQALAGDPAHGDLARGIYYSVLFMMAMPFAIVGTFATFAYRAVKREQHRLAEDGERRLAEDGEKRDELAR